MSSTGLLWADDYNDDEDLLRGLTVYVYRYVTRNQSHKITTKIDSVSSFKVIT